MGVLKTTDQFVAEAKKVHGDKYDYSKSKYVGARKNVNIMCPIHGNFNQLPMHHLKGYGCKHCSGNTHYREEKVNVRVKGGGKLLPVANGRYCIVDEDDYDTLMRYNWSINAKGYARNGRLGLLHRFIMEVSSQEYIDHEDGDKLNNRKSNLRICTHQQNSFNKHSIKGASKYKGVGKNTRVDKWTAQIQKGTDRFWLGYFEDEIKAAKAYDAKAKELHGEFAWLNFKED